jgi:uncharacterized protein
MRRCAFILAWLCCLSVFAAEVIPPAPDHYFNDYAHVVDSGTADGLNLKLDNFERTTGNQVVVAIYPKMQSNSSIDDYAVRVFRAWKVGQKDKNNGVVLFVFVDDKKMFIEVGYGLEGALPDATCKQITEYEIKPHFKNGDYTGGVVAGVNAIIAATQHEYKGNGSTVNSRQDGGSAPIGPHMIFLSLFCLVIFINILRAYARSRQHGMVIGRRGVGYYGGGWGGWGGGSWGGGGGGGFSGGGGGFGGFSGGGGSSGGGGAGSSW